MKKYRNSESCISDKICAIHQPNFFPWIGYFDKINKCDVFVILDDVQFERKSAGTWMNRVAINIANQKSWITAPVVRSGGLLKIHEMEFQDTDWRKKIKKTIQMNYSKCQYYTENKDAIWKLLDYPSNNISEFNINSIGEVCSLLCINFKNKAVNSSSLGVESSSTQRLIDIARKVGCNTYLAGGGAGGYQEDEKFSEQGIHLIYQNFKHPEYCQKSSKFISGLSIIDVLLNIGLYNTRVLVSSI